MPSIVHLDHDTYAPLAALEGLLVLARDEELVLVSTHQRLPPERFGTLRQALAQRRIVTLVVDDRVTTTEREVVEELLNDGIIPLILTTCDPPPDTLTCWLDSDDTHNGPVQRRR